ncbi:MAG TPA: MerR family transcriptional regulator [Cellulomonas sp.]
MTQGATGGAASRGWEPDGPASTPRPDDERDRQVRAPEPWPRGISRKATMRISDVLAALQIEFPAVTTSKLRFWEEQGLVTPLRTPAGYRQYSPADVERLRYVLRCQRDRYLPLKVIGEQLAALDAGEDDEQPRARLATSDGVPAAGARRWTAETLAHDAGVPVALVTDLLANGVLHANARGVFDLYARDVVQAAARLAEHGLDARHLRAFRTAADRQIDLVEQVVAPVRGQRTASARARAGTLAAELGELCTQMHTALVRAAIADLEA